MLAIASVWSDKHDGPSIGFEYALLGIISTVAMFFLNLVPWAAVQESSESDPQHQRAKGFLICSTVTQVVCFLSACGIFIAVFAGHKEFVFAGVLYMMHNLLLFISAWIMRGLRTNPSAM